MHNDKRRMAEEPFTHLALFLVEKRKEQGLSLRKLANQADVALGYLSDIESGKVTPSWSTFTALAHALNMTLDQLVVGALFSEVHFNKEERRRVNILCSLLDPETGRKKNPSARRSAPKPRPRVPKAEKSKALVLTQ